MLAQRKDEMGDGDSLSTASTRGVVNFSPAARKKERKKRMVGKAKKSPKKKTNAELLRQLETDLQAEQDRLALELVAGENAAAVAVQANARGGALRSQFDEYGRKAATVTVQAAQRGHSERRDVKDPFRHPIIGVKDSANAVLERLISEKMTPMLQFEDRTTVTWETKGTKDLMLEKLRSRGRLTEEEEEKWLKKNRKAMQSKKDRGGGNNSEAVGSAALGLEGLLCMAVGEPDDEGKTSKTKEEKKQSDVGGGGLEGLLMKAETTMMQEENNNNNYDKKKKQNQNLKQKQFISGLEGLLTKAGEEQEKKKEKKEGGIKNKKSTGLGGLEGLLMKASGTAEDKEAGNERIELTSSGSPCMAELSTPYSRNPNLVENVKNISRSVNSKTPAVVTNEDMLLWLGKSNRPKVPLDKDVRAKRREAKYSAFADFVDTSLKILDDYEDREKMIKGCDKLKKRAKEMIYKDEKDFDDCNFRDQLIHEYLHEKPLVSQRKFQDSFDAYKRDEKELKVLMATIRRLENSDCTFLACKLCAAHIDDTLAKRISAGLKFNDFLQHLHLPNNFITDEGCRAIAEMLKYNTSLTIINLCGNLITDDGAYCIGEMLKVNKHVVDINLEFKEKKRPYRDKDKPYPKITAPGAAMIAFGIQSNFTLTSLNLKDNKIWDIGAVALASSIKKRCILKYLNVALNDIGEKGGLALARAVEENECLEHLNASGNEFPDSVGQAFAHALKTNTTMQTLDLYSNSFSVSSIRLLAKSVAANDNVRVVSVYGNKNVDSSNRNDAQLDNLCETKLRTWWEDRCIKNLVIWHKRLYKEYFEYPDYLYRDDKDGFKHFLQIQFGVVLDGRTGDIYRAKEDESVIRRLGLKLYKSLDGAGKEGGGWVNPMTPMTSVVEADNEVLSSTSIRLPPYSISLLTASLATPSLLERLRTSYCEYSATSKVDTTLSSVPVMAYNTSDNPFYSSLTRLMHLRVPVPRANLQAGTVSICVLKYYKDNLRSKRLDISSQSWYAKQKQAAEDYGNHVYARVNLPPDSYTDVSYPSQMLVKYPGGIDNNRLSKDKELTSIVERGFKKEVGLRHAGDNVDEARNKEKDSIIQGILTDGNMSEEAKVRQGERAKRLKMKCEQAKRVKLCK